MYRLIQIIGCLFIFSTLLNGQGESRLNGQGESGLNGQGESGLSNPEVPDFNRINNETYRLYLAQEWDSLLVIGREALRMEIDYYYLRMRLGIALYEKEDYRSAAIHFRKALSWNNDDPVALEYLYYSLFFSGRKEQASLVRKKFRGDLALRLQPEKGRFLESMNVEYLYSRRTDPSLKDDLYRLFDALPPGTQYVPVQVSNASLYMVHDPGPGISLHHSYTFLHKTSHLYYNDGFYQLILPDHAAYQHQYYISPRITTISGLTIIPAFHVLSVNYQVLVPGSTGYQGGNQSNNFPFSRYTDYGAGMGLEQSAGRWDLGMGIYYSSLNRAQQVQGRLGLTWYPLGNLDLYTGAFLNSRLDMNSTNRQPVFIPEASFGFGIRKKVWIDLKAAAGEMRNYLENNGYIVYNGFGEIIDRKITLSVTIPVSEKGSMVYLGGRWMAGKSLFVPADVLSTSGSNTIMYSNISTYGGIIWKF